MVGESGDHRLQEPVALVGDDAAGSVRATRTTVPSISSGGKHADHEEVPGAHGERGHDADQHEGDVEERGHAAVSDR